MEAQHPPPASGDTWETLDLLGFEIREQKPSDAGGGAPPSEPPGWDDLTPAADIHDRRARNLARYLLIAVIAGLLLVVIIGAGVLVAIGALESREAKDTLALLAPPLFTLLGTAAAFYFTA